MPIKVCREETLHGNKAMRVEGTKEMGDVGWEEEDVHVMVPCILQCLQIDPTPMPVR